MPVCTHWIWFWTLVVGRCDLRESSPSPRARLQISPASGVRGRSSSCCGVLPMSPRFALQRR
eukprot:4213649-Prymnesium_polylepis.1